MEDIYLKNERIRHEAVLRDSTSDFMTKYFSVYHLQSLSETRPDMITAETVSALEDLLKKSEFARQRRGFFLFRLAADTLSSIIVHSGRKSVAEQSVSALRNILAVTDGHAHRATAEALGSLPFAIQGPDIKDIPACHAPLISWQKLLDEKGVSISSPPRFVGRSLVAPLAQKDSVVVFKVARAEDSPETLAKEAVWMEHLQSAQYDFSPTFHIPSAIKLKEAYLFRLQGIPSQNSKNLKLHPQKYAIGFIANKDYFTYPNDSGDKSDDSLFKEIMYRNARLMGNLSGAGIIHSAPIPLFHNRVQRERRRDNGLYEWFRAGRLDRWLASCEYPNMGMTGIRDFEHLIPFRGASDRSLYRHIGMHLLSMLLVSGSYFRNKNKDKVGFDADGNPVDARDLFNENIFQEIIQGIFLHYYRGFTGIEFTGDLPFDLDKLTFRMIEEMGVDRHMEEILRVPDQNQMTDAAFKSFLEERGCSREEIKAFQKGAQDIVIYTGPHLGGFNERISLPELIESVETMSALCIAGRYWKENYQSL